MFDLPRSSILNKDLLLHLNPYKTLKNVHMKNLLAFKAKLNLLGARNCSISCGVISRPVNQTAQG